MNSEIAFYKELAKEIKPDGYRSFLFVKEASAFLHIITPNNSWLCIEKSYYGGFDIDFEYKPTEAFGRGCRCNENPLYEITVETLKKAEMYGKTFGYKGHIMVPNTYDGRSHRETVWKSPVYYENAYQAMKKRVQEEYLQEL